MMSVFTWLAFVVATLGCSSVLDFEGKHRDSSDSMDTEVDDADMATERDDGFIDIDVDPDSFEPVPDIRPDDISEIVDDDVGEMSCTLLGTEVRVSNDSPRVILVPESCFHRERIRRRMGRQSRLEQRDLPREGVIHRCQDWERRLDNKRCGRILLPKSGFYW
jgi:hypothetical protein